MGSVKAPGLSLWEQGHPGRLPGWLPPSAGLKISPMVSVPCDRLLCFIAESPALGVFALKVFCSARASKACLGQGIALSAGKLLGEIHCMGEIQHCVCIFALQEHDIL